MSRLARGGAAVRGAVGFLTRLPVGRGAADWAAFSTTPLALPVVGYLVGAGLAVPLALGALGVLPGPTAAAAFLGWCYLLTGINHVDALADLGDAAVVHGDRVDRLAVLSDTTVGAGAVLAVGLVLVGLGLAGLAIGARPLRAVGIVVAAEVGAKLGMAVVAALGRPATDGLGAALAEPAGPASLALPALASVPAAALTWPSPAAGAALLAAAGVALGCWAWARSRLGGVNGDVMGATNELARVVALHVGVIAWTLS